jgi:ATP-dependent RNA helicase DeaD
MTTSEPPPPAANPFAALGLSDGLIQALVEVGYEAPTPIQTAAIPPLLAGRDLIGQAQTGTGKTAAFGLPMLQAIDPAVPHVQGLVLAPTRELAIQVAEALHTYGRHLQRLSVLPVYGGQSLGDQQRRLERGVQIVVGTPGRVMDHLRRGALRLDRLRMAVLDEADEMLRMGFLEDVEWILAQTPPSSAGRQTALFSATMPPEVRRVAQRHLTDPLQIALEHKALTVPAVEQKYLLVSQHQKLDSLTRLLETEPTEAVLVFTRTKTAAAQVAERLEARGYSVAALHGDMAQPLRERVLDRLHKGTVEIVIATDVAARGLDVERITHVINYDVPNDVDSYVHRIGRTARGGRSGTAVLFVTPRERRMLHEIERHTGMSITPMRMPTSADIAARRTELLKEDLRKTLEQGDLDLYLAVIEELVEEGFDISEVAAAAAALSRRDRPLAPPPMPDLLPAFEPGGRRPAGADGDMVRLFFNSGAQNGVRPADIVGAIANEAGVAGKEIGAIDIHERFAIVEVPRQRQKQILERMAGASLRGRTLQIRLADPDTAGGAAARRTDRPERTDRGPRPASRSPRAPRTGAGAAPRSAPHRPKPPR